MCIYVCWWVSDRERNSVRIPSATISTLPHSFFCKHFWYWKPSFTKKISSGSSSLAFLLVKNEPHNGYHFVNFSKNSFKRSLSPQSSLISLSLPLKVMTLHTSRPHLAHSSLSAPTCKLAVPSKFRPYGADIIFSTTSPRRLKPLAQQNTISNNHVMRSAKRKHNRHG